MVAPITGPFVTNKSLFGPPNSFGNKPVWFSFKRTWYRQEKPYNLPLDYSVEQKRIISFSAADPSSFAEVSSLHTGNAYQTDMSTQAYNQAYGDLREKFKGESAQLANSLLERQKTLDMIYKRAVQLTRFTRAVRHFQWDEAASILGFKRDRRNRVVNLHNVRHTAKAFGDNWLEFHFGLKPLIGEIGRGIELLQADYPRLHLYKKVSRTRKWRDPPQDLGAYTRRVSHTLEIGWRVGCDLKIINPQLLLADQLGIVNPASFIWEAIPFSFLVDWFANVSDFLSNLYPFPGAVVERPYRTSFFLWTQVHKSNADTGGDYTSFTGEVFNLVRTSGPLPGPTLSFDMPSRLSPARAATAIALLTKMLRE